MRSLRVIAFAVASVVTVAGSSFAYARPHCQPVEATIIDRVVDVGCPTGVPVCVAGTFRGKHGFNGTDVFVLGSRGVPPATAPAYRPVSGTITLTFDDGSTLTALETSIGNVDTTTGEGHAGGTQEFTGGTGRYAGATGYAYLSQHWETDHFVTRIEGEVCRPKS